MEVSPSGSTFEMLPDEILLEVCKYSLCTDILQSFTGLNRRLTRMITQYLHHVSFHKTSISTFDYLCINVLPQIGSHIRSFFIDCCYSILQDELFIEHFGKKMSALFPKLERLSLVYYQYDQLIAFLNTLHDLNHLTEIRLYSLFDIQRSHQPVLVRSIVQANNHRFTTLLLDEQSSCLSFDDSDRYLNIIQLRIKLRSAVDLPSLFAAVPNVQYLDILIEGKDEFSKDFDRQLHPLLHLIDFRLKYIMHGWKLEELSLLLVQLPIVQYLSIFITTFDRRLLEGDVLIPVLPSAIQQFNYAINFISDTPFDRVKEIITSWPSSHPITCLFNEKLLFLHTLPWRFPHIELDVSYGKMIPYCANNVDDYDRSLEQLYLWIDTNFGLTRSLPMLRQCRRVKGITIVVENDREIDVKGTSIKHENRGCTNDYEKASNLCRKYKS
jgi:hypothetical protein